MGIMILKAAWASSLLVAAIVLTCLACSVGYAASPGSTEPKFTALPRDTNLEISLAPARGPRAVIVYGSGAQWTKAAAEEVRDLIEKWSGVRLELADDLTVTSERTWLICEKYFRTPLVVVGNARDNRVCHALGTRFLDYSNYTWPGGDRFIIRTIFEPFTADVNYIALQASTPEGMQAAVARFEQLLHGMKPDPSATIAHTHLSRRRQGQVAASLQRQLVWSTGQLRRLVQECQRNRPPDKGQAVPGLV
ncbi:MAG: hypothetical protein HQ546_02820 [Planctomycetes bacterium]|nr:hypothetical protein [Planctomycetota bacterium]